MKKNKQSDLDKLFQLKLPFRFRNKKWEIQLIQRLNKIFGEENVERGSPDDPDDFGPPVDAPYFWIDVEYGDYNSLEDILKRAGKNCDLPRPVLVIGQRPQTKACIAMYLEDFLIILDELINRDKGCFNDK